MTKAQIDQAYHLVAELSMLAKYADQIGNARISASMRNAAALLQVMVEEYEATEEIAMRRFVDDIREAEMRQLVQEKPDG